MCTHIDVDFDSAGIGGTKRGRGNRRGVLEIIMVFRTLERAHRDRNPECKEHEQRGVVVSHGTEQSCEA